MTLHGRESWLSEEERRVDALALRADERRDKLPEAVGYLTEQVIELKKLVAELQPQPSDKHVLVEIEDACRIIRKAKPTIYTLVRKGLLPAYKKGKKLYFYEDELLSWIENGRRKSAEQTYEEMLANMQGGVRHKSKSSMKF